MKLPSDVATSLAIEYVTDGLSTAYSKMTYDDFLKVIGNRDDDYGYTKWTQFKDLIFALDKLGTFFPVIVNHGHELRNKDGSV